MTSNRLQTNEDGAIEIDRRCDALESDWRSGRRTSIEQYMLDAPPAIKERLFEELVLTEWESRVSIGDRIAWCSYLARVPARGDRLLHLWRISTVSSGDESADADAAGSLLMSAGKKRLPALYGTQCKHWSRSVQSQIREVFSAVTRLGDTVLSEACWFDATPKTVAVWVPRIWLRLLAMSITDDDSLQAQLPLETMQCRVVVIIDAMLSVLPPLRQNILKHALLLESIDEVAKSLNVTRVTVEQTLRVTDELLLDAMQRNASSFLTD
jgi:hypothetical protein